MKKTNGLNKYLSSGRTKYLIAFGIGAFYVGRKFIQHVCRKDLKDKVILITGGSRGLGLAIGMEAAARGARLAICARDEVHLNLAASQLLQTGAEVLTVSADLRDEQQVLQMVDKVIAYYGHIDVLINNAGVMLVAPENVLQTADYKEVMDANFWSAFYTTQAALPYFRKQKSGHIVNITSIGGKIAVPHMLPYSVSKFALSGFSQGLSAELSESGIKVTTVTPNLMITGSPRNITLKGDHQAEYAWFKISDSLPLLSQTADDAAKSILLAIEQEKRNVTLTLTAKLAVTLQALAPDSVAAVSAFANKYLPHSENTTAKKGYESESESSQGTTTALTDQAEIKYNQL